MVSCVTLPSGVREIVRPLLGILEKPLVPDELAEHNGTSDAQLYCPSLGKPVQLTNLVSFMPHSAARAFMTETNSSTLPHKYSATATHESLADATIMLFNSSSSLYCALASKNACDPPIDAALSDADYERVERDSAFFLSRRTQCSES